MISAAKYDIVLD